jgi:hypothetical protein
MRLVRRLGSEVRALRAAASQDRTARILVGLLLGGAVLLIGMAIVVDVLRFLDRLTFDGWRFSLVEDGALPELFGYLCELVAAAFLLIAYARARLRSLLFLGVLYVFIFLDDAFTYHERVSRLLVDTLGLQDVAGLRATDLGELVAWGFAALVLLPLLVWTWRGRRPADSGVVVVFGALFFALAFFAAGLDLVHVLITSSAGHRVVGWLEDGGELFVVALTASAAVLYASRFRAGPPQPVDDGATQPASATEPPTA